MSHDHSAPAPTKRPFLRTLAVYVVLTSGAVVIACLVAFLLFTDVFVNALLKGRNIRNFEKTNPNYTLRIRGVGYDILENRLTCDSITLTPSDSGFSCTIAASSISGVGWIPLFMGRALTPDRLANSEVDAETFVLTFPREQYQLSCGRLHVSVADSAIVADSFELRPIDDDNQFFAADRYRRTRYNLRIPHATMTGSTCMGLMRRDMYCGRIARLEEPILDILTNKDKRPQGDTTNPLMPHEVLSTIKAKFQVDSVVIVNGSLRYGERMRRGAQPASITFDSMNVAIGGIANHCCDHDSTVVIARGRFMKAGTLDLRMAIPVASPAFSLRYSGTLSKMPLSALNPFVAIGEHVRIKSGYVENAQFDIAVRNGRADGRLRLVYTDLAIAFRDEETGSEKGILNRLTSLVANKVKLRNDNVPDESGAMKIGVVAYRRDPGDTFFQFLWFALRSGFKDVIGF